MRGIIGNIRERQPNYIDMSISKETGITRYSIRAANTLNDSYGNGGGVGGSGCVELFTAEMGREFRSASIREKKLHVAHGAGRDRKVTRMIFDPSDFFNPVAAPLIPADNQLMFMRIQKFSEALNDWEDEGPINVVLPKHFLQGMRPVLTLHGNAPAIASTGGAFPDEDAMHFHLPMFSASVYISNLSEVGSLHVSFNPGMPTVVVPPGENFAMYDVNIMEVLISSDADIDAGGVAPAFNLVFGLQNGP